MGNVVVHEDEFDPKKIYNDLIKRCKKAKEWYVYCIADEAWVPKGNEPFEIIIKNGILQCRVVSYTLIEALKLIANNVPVIQFIEYPPELE
jgi:hypothetical protein